MCVFIYLFMLSFIYLFGVCVCSSLTIVTSCWDSLPTNMVSRTARMLLSIFALLI